MGPWNEEQQRLRADRVQRLLDDPALTPDARRIWRNVQRGLSRSEAQYNARVREVYTQMRQRHTEKWL